MKGGARVSVSKKSREILSEIGELTDAEHLGQAVDTVLSLVGESVLQGLKIIKSGGPAAQQQQLQGPMMVPPPPVQQSAPRRRPKEPVEL